MRRKKDWPGEYRLGKGKKMIREGRKMEEGEKKGKEKDGKGEKLREGDKMRRKEEEEK